MLGQTLYLYGLNDKALKTKGAKTISVYTFMKLFPGEAEAAKFFEDRLWPEGPSCPKCKSKRAVSRASRKGHRCMDCRADYTVRAGTVFESSRLPLHKWLYTMYLTMTARKGISGLQLSKETGTTQKTAWFLLQRIRELCKENSPMLKGVVEVDETYIGGLEKNKHKCKKAKGGRGAKTKIPVVGLRDRGGKVTARPVKSVDSKALQGIIGAYVEKGGTIGTDGAKFYDAVKGYGRVKANHSVKEFVDGMASTNGIESVWALLKRGYYGTYHHFSPKHMDRYVDEFTFRLNKGNCGIGTVDRTAGMAKKAKGKKLTYKALTAQKQNTLGCN